MLKTFADNLGLSQPEVETLLSYGFEDLLNTPAVQQKLASLDVALLKETLPMAGSVLATKLPPFYDWLKNELGVARVPDGPDHTTKWVVGFLNNQESLSRLVELHRPVPLPALERAVPRLVSLFENVDNPQVKQAWKTAIASLCLILVAAAREEAPVTEPITPEILQIG